MAWRLMESVRRYDPGMPFQILAQDYLPMLPWRGKATVTAARSCHSGGGDLRWLNKLEAMGNSRFAETLFLDCDMLTTGPLADWFDQMATDDLTFWNHRRLPEDRSKMEFNLLDPEAFCAHYQTEAVPTVLGGGHYFIRKSGRSELILQRIAAVMMEASRDPAALYWQLAGQGNIVGDEPAASMVVVEESVRLPVCSHPAGRPPVGCYMPPWQEWVNADPSTGSLVFRCPWSGGVVAPQVVHFAGTGKEDPVYRQWVDAAGAGQPGQNRQQTAHRREDGRAKAEPEPEPGLGLIGWTGQRFYG